MLSLSGTPSVFKLTKRLGRGHASVVWRCKDSNRGETLAVKFGLDKAHAMEEVETLKRLMHPNVITVIDFIEWNNSFGIVMHGVDMDLRHFMETELYDSVTVIDFSRQCARGLHYVHTQETLHADLKPENIGISIAKKKGKGERSLIHVRILDFGSAKMIHRHIAMNEGFNMTQDSIELLFN